MEKHIGDLICNACSVVDNDFLAGANILNVVLVFRVLRAGQVVERTSNTA